MNEELKAIGQRIRGLREVENLSVAAVAASCGLTERQLADFEAGLADIPVGVLHSIAKRFKVELTTLLTGDEPHLRGYCLTRRGAGVRVSRRREYQYQSLAYTFADRLAEPFLVTVEPSPVEEPIPLNSHAGQEFNYVLSGTLQVCISGRDFVLEEGDSLYFNAGLDHGMKALNGKAARFLACIF